MINVIVPLVEKPQEYLSMISENSKNRDCVIYVGVLNKFKDLLFPKNVIVKYYKDNSGKEEIINSLQKCDRRQASGHPAYLTYCGKKHYNILSL